VQITMVLPMVRRLLPSLEGCVEIDADSFRSSFHLRPSVLSNVWAYVDSVSSGISEHKQQEKSLVCLKQADMESGSQRREQEV
jgi:hypothetical protein